MTTPLIYYIVNSKELTHEEFEKLQVKPNLPYNPNFREVRQLAENINAKKILIDTDQQQIIIK